jgi:hypothetical protein
VQIVHVRTEHTHKKARYSLTWKTGAIELDLVWDGHGLLDKAQCICGIVDGHPEELDSVTVVQSRLCWLGWLLRMAVYERPKQRLLIWNWCTMGTM